MKRNDLTGAIIATVCFDLSVFVMMEPVRDEQWLENFVLFLLLESSGMVGCHYVVVMT